MPGICQRCKKKVYAAEERLALSGSSWHQECFTCAVCNKSLDSTTVTENRENQEIYCRNCYRIYFTMQGYGYGPNKPTLVANTPPLEDCYEVTPSNSKTSVYNSRSRSAKPKIDSNFQAPPSWKGLQYWTKHPRVKHYSHQVSTEPRQFKKCNSDADTPANIPIIKSTPRPEAKNYDSTVVNCSPNHYIHHAIYPTDKPSGSKFKPKPLSQQRSQTASSGKIYSRVGHSTNADTCAKCGKPVYFNERKFGYNGVYHPQCFVCTACGKSLDSTTVSENDGQLFCKGCYKRYIAAEGVGFGIGAGTLQTH